MRLPAQYGLEQARTQLPSLVSAAQAGVSSVITRHGKPFAAIVPLAKLDSPSPASGLLALRGSGSGLWGKSPASTVDALRDEWGSAKS